MMRKTIIILSLVSVLALSAALMAVEVKATTCCANAQDDCPDGYNCLPHTQIEDYDDVCGTDSTKPRYCVAQTTSPAPSTIGAGDDIGPQDYVKVRSEVKIKLKPPAGQSGALKEVTFKKGALVYEAKTNAVGTACYSLTTVSEGNSCYASEVGMIAFLSALFTVTAWIFYILTLLVVVMIIIGGFTIITASGSPERAAKGRAILTYAIIGLAIALLAKIIPSIVSFIIGI